MMETGAQLRKRRHHKQSYDTKESNNRDIKIAKIILILTFMVILAFNLQSIFHSTNVLNKAHDIARTYTTK
jgi:hypothetical protein